MRRLPWRWLSLAPFRLRILFRGAFLLLALSILALAFFVLQEEQRLSYRNYADGFAKNAAQIVARLRHPAGQLALLNPPHAGVGVTPLHPFLLPFSGLDFDDQAKVQQAVEMAGCMVQYPNTAGVCVAVGNNAYAGGFVYVVGRFASRTLVEHERGAQRLDTAHRLRIGVDLRGQRYGWIAPFERLPASASSVLRGRLTGFADRGDDAPAKRPVQDFRGWLWQSRECLDGNETADCLHRSFFSVRLPVEVLRDALFEHERPVWPPPDLDRILVHLQVLAPGAGQPIFDSDSSGATPPFSLQDLAPLLLPGERLSIRKLGTHTELLQLVGVDPKAQPTSHWVDRLIRHLARMQGESAPVHSVETIVTPSGSYELRLTGDVRTANQSLAAVATRVSWFVVAMLLAVVLVWLIIETNVMRRINLLRRRADSVSKTVKATEGLEGFDLSDLRGPDELGVLAACLSDLLRRVQEDLSRDRIRAEQEKDLWHAVGHEIMSPLQSLMALHGEPDDASRRYIERMQQAVRVLYGSASPSEAFQSTTLQLSPLDLEEFLAKVAHNAPSVGIDAVAFYGSGQPVLVRAEEYSLEDVIAHLLNNAARYRRAGTPIDIRLEAISTSAIVTVHNHGSVIDEALIDRIFEYGVSDAEDSGAQGHRGQGLFVAKTYMAKMGGTIVASNLAGGVRFTLTLPRVAGTGGS